MSLAVSIVRRISKRSGSAIGGETSSDMIPAGYLDASRIRNALIDTAKAGSSWLGTPWRYMLKLGILVVDAC